MQLEIQDNRLNIIWNTKVNQLLLGDIEVCLFSGRLKWDKGCAIKADVDLLFRYMNGLESGPKPYRRACLSVFHIINSHDW